MVFQPKDLTIAEMYQEIARLRRLIDDIHDIAIDTDIPELTALIDIRDLTSNSFSLSVGTRRYEFDRIVGSLGYDGDENSLTVGEIRRALP